LNQTAFESKGEIKIKSAILEKLNSPLAIKEVNLTELKIGQVLVRVIVSGICGSQLHEISGNKGNGKFLPHLMGHEGCGLVEEIGPGVTRVRPGDKVVMHWRQGLGIEADFPRYNLDGIEFSSGKVNTLTEKAIVSENRLTVVPADTNSELAALLGCSLTTALGVIDNESNLKFGERVAVVGCGGVGLSVLLAARIRGAGKIYAIDAADSKKEMCLVHGATDFFSKIKDLPADVDLIIDTTGIPEIISEIFLKLSDNGRLFLLGQPNPGQSLVLPEALRFFRGVGQSIKASQGGATVPQSDIPRYLELFKLGLLHIDKLITHRFSLDEVNLAFEVLKSGTAGRIMINIAKEV
jgi:S-(hydroxymethyl)glutathione dehydrogenase/alcohol dehydrogenase